MKTTGLIFAGVLAMSASLAPASAAPMMMSGVSSAPATESMIVQVQRRGVRPGGRGVVVRRGGHRGAAVGAAVGLGILGAAIAAGAAQSHPGYYPGYYEPAPVYGQCWLERREAYDAWGNFVGYRRIRVCN